MHTDFHDLEKRNHSPGLSDDTRGFGIQIDFLTGATVYIAAWILFLALSIQVLGGFTPPATGDRVAAERASDTLVDDLLATSPNAVTLDRACTEAFFAKSAPGSCGYDPTWSSGGSDYLEEALAISTKAINVKIRDTSGNIQSINGQSLELGESIPDDNENVEGWERQGTLDYNGDGTAEWVIIDVRVWS
jgi:hypothetical protein